MTIGTRSEGLRAAGRNSSVLRRARVGKCQWAQLFAVKINETQAPPMRNQAGGQRIVAERAAAEVRRQAADIGKRGDFDAQQIEFGDVGGDNLERDAAEAQHVGWVEPAKPITSIRCN